MIVWLASYPRSGNSLLANLIKHYYSVNLFSIYEDTDKAVGYTYLAPDELAEAAVSKNIYFVKTHELPGDDFPAVYLVRDGRDVVVSYAHYIINNSINLPDPRPENIFFWALDALINSSDQFSGWDNHVTSWTSRSGRTVVLRYEELIDPRLQLEQVQFSLNELGLTGFSPVTQLPLPQFSKYHKEKPVFFRKGRPMSWATELPADFHIQFWERFGETMLTLGYEKNTSNPTDLRSDFLFNSLNASIDRAGLQISSLQQAMSSAHAANQAIILRVENEIGKLELQLAEKEQIIHNLNDRLGRAESQVQRIEFDFNTSMSQIQGMEKQLDDKEKVIQDFRHSPFYWLVNGPLRHIPLFPGLLLRLRGLRRVFLPKVGVLDQHAPKPLQIPGGYSNYPAPQDPPAIAMVTPSYNQAHFIERTVSSVLDQNYPNLQYVVQDGGSADDTMKRVAKYRSRLASLESRPDDGQAHAINLGFQHLNGEIMAYLNSDDILLPGSLAYVADYFQKHPQVDAIYSHRVIIDEQDREIGRWLLPPHDPYVMFWADYVPQETLFWRRRIWERSGAAMDESFKFALDWDLLMRFQQNGAVIRRVPRFLAAFRVHEAQKTSAQINQVGMAEMERIRRQYLKRDVDQMEINQHIKPYLNRSILYQKLYRLGIHKA